MSRACAEPATIDEARIVAERWIAHIVATDGAWGGCGNPSLGASEEIAAGETTLAYRFAVLPRGHVVVPANKELPPVKSYSTTGGFDQNGRDYYAVVVGDLTNVTRNLDQQGVRVAAFAGGMLSAKNRTAWDTLLEGNPGVRVFATGAPPVAAVVGPLMTTRWDQVAPYNVYCPTVSGRSTYVGCLAAAVAQIMKYWNYPSAGAGSHCYIWDGDGGGSSRLCADYAHGYQWSLMPTCLYPSSPSQAIAEVGRLMSDVGIAVEMDYGVNGSAAYLEPVLTAMPGYFGYSSDIAQLMRRSFSSDDAWFQQFRTEIDAARPVLYAVYGDAGGHAAVVDGYRVDTGINFIHVNFGWSGYCDSYYGLDGIEAGGYVFDDHYWESMIRNIRPAGGGELTGLSVDGPWVDGNINWPGDVDRFTFAVGAAGNYVVDTRAGTLSDNFAALYGPNSSTTLVEEDNDDGDGLCARITRWLNAGTYYVSVHANAPTATGTFQVRVTTGNALDHIEISGPTALLALDVAYYTCTAVYRDGSRVTVVPAWSDTTRYAAISSAGQLRTLCPRGVVNFEVRASYMDEGRRYTAALPVRLYPIGRLRPDGRPVRDAISARGEVDWYILLIRTAATYGFHVSGGTLRQAGLYVYDPGGFLDGAVSEAPGHMPSLRMPLAKGVYLLGVTGGSGSAVGTYRIWVKPE